METDKAQKFWDTLTKPAAKTTNEAKSDADLKKPKTVDANPIVSMDAKTSEDDTIVIEREYEFAGQKTV